MPSSNYAAIRYRIINLCFTSRTKKGWTLEELLERLRENDITISKRTLERDVEMMRHDSRLKFYAPIAYDKSRKVFSYEDPTYTTLSLHLEAEDLFALQDGERMLRHISLLNEFVLALQKVITQAAGHRYLERASETKGQHAVDDFKKRGEALLKAIARSLEGEGSGGR